MQIYLISLVPFS